MNMHAIERAMLQAQILELCLLVIVLLSSIMISYYVLKIAIREAIKESGLIRALNTIAATQRPSELPVMRVD